LKGKELGNVGCMHGFKICPNLTELTSVEYI
jgi:hypothetical protein